MNWVISVKLRVSKFFKKKRNYLKLVGSIVCCTYIMTGVRIGFKTLNDTLKNDYYTLFYDIDDDLIEPLARKDYENIRVDKFNKMSVLSIDMSEVRDLEFLEYCPNLKKLEIRNAELLTDLHIDELNETNIKEYYFFFDRNYVLGHMNESADFSRLSHPENIKKISFMNNLLQDELDGIIFKKYLNIANVNGNNYDFLYDQLIDMVSNNNLDKNQNELIKFINICNYIVDYLYYDLDIREVLENNSEISRFSKEYSLAKEYNKKCLTSVAGNSNSVSAPGICANYSALLSAFCIQNNIEIYSITGTLNGSEHAWNLVKFQDNYYYVDLTQLDIMDEYSSIVSNYKNYPSQENPCNLLNYLFIPLDSELASNYLPKDSIEDIISQKVSTSPDDKFFGTLVNEKNEIKWYLLLSTILNLTLLCELAYEYDKAKAIYKDYRARTKKIK